MNAHIDNIRQLGADMREVLAGAPESLRLVTLYGGVNEAANAEERHRQVVSIGLDLERVLDLALRLRAASPLGWLARWELALLELGQLGFSQTELDEMADGLVRMVETQRCAPGDLVEFGRLYQMDRP
jgi:hypothetical protein